MSKWEKVAWSEVVEIKNGRNQKAVEDINGQYPIYGSGGVMGYANNYICDENTVIIGRKGNINKPIYVSEKFWNVDTAFGLNAKIGRLFPKYLFYFCVMFNFEKLNTTVTIPSLTKSNLLNIEIPLPPLETQKQIAKTLDITAELLAMRKQQLAGLDEFLVSIFFKMFGDPVLNNKKWVTQPMLSVGKFVSGGTPSKERNDFWTGNFPWVSPKDMKVPYISNSIDFISHKVFEETSLKKIAPGQLLIVVRGMILAHSFPTAINTVEVSINQDMKAILPNEDLDVIYLKHCLDNMKHQILKIITTAAHGTKKFDADSMEKVFIPVPPLKLQNQFATIVTKIEEQKALVKQAIDETQYLFDSLMSEYF
ncbi:restriction endonuclease subunit S [Paenibacillus thalictri]|uniref:Type I restriction modification DNA specificity domain-containing protein n=1 Tax=Paenibacillus thalictri TaxID=2527873 RepID=A0A4Q9DCQ1_9BACL|nr:restriction endonuclease subunit S [Paenibacillus thalictri]TBL68363.1 hypothetical protein EYB31_38270 [Paenibacillus thalictri]